MIVEEDACRARGFVTPSFIDVSTGERVEFSGRFNKLSYMSAEAMAAAFGGNPSYIPARIGFIYGPDNATSDVEIKRDQSWSSLKDDIKSFGGNADIQVVGFSCSPTVGGSDGEYSSISGKPANEVTFHAVSNSADAGSAYSNRAFGKDDYIFQAALLGVDAGRMYVISRVSLKEGDKYLQKPGGFEIALDWTVVFK